MNKIHEIGLLSLEDGYTNTHIMAIILDARYMEVHQNEEANECMREGMKDREGAYAHRWWTCIYRQYLDKDIE